MIRQIALSETMPVYDAVGAVMPPLSTTAPAGCSPTHQRAHPAPDLPANLLARLQIGSADTFRCGMKSPI